MSTTVSVTVPANAVGRGIAQAMTSDSTQSASFYDNFAVCNPPNQVYVGGWVRTPTGTGSGVLSVVLAGVADERLANTIPFTQISWTSTANGNATADIPAGTFNGGTLALRNIAAGTWVENCHTFSYANTAVVAARHLYRAGDLQAGVAVIAPRVCRLAGMCVLLALMAMAAPPSPRPISSTTRARSLSRPRCRARWRDGASGGRQMSNDIEGGATVTIRLNTQPWLNRIGRIYLALPQQPIGVVNVEWATQGRMLPGKLQSGERTLVFMRARSARRCPRGQLHGAASSPTAAASRSRNACKFHFEIDVD